MKLGKIIQHTITIEPTQNYGFIVQVGCGRFGFESANELIHGLAAYLNDPKGFEKEYNELLGAVPERQAVTTPEQAYVDPRKPVGFGSLNSVGRQRA